MDAQNAFASFRSREDLISAVERGEISPDAAEQEAVQLGLGNLLPQHPAEAFDPMKQTRWSLLMGVVWVLTRNATAVRNSWNDFIVTQYRWTKDGPGGLVGPLRVRQRRRQWVHEIPVSRLGEHLFEHQPGRSFSVSWAMLKLACANGSVASWGRDLRQGDLGDVTPIPPANWDALHVAQMPTPESKPSPLPFPFGREAGEDMLHFGNGTPVYIGVTVDRASLLAKFPMHDASGQPEQNLALDPMKQIADVTDAHETAATYKKRIRTEAIKTAFPAGKPKVMKIKERNRQLEEAVKAIDESFGLTDERDWRRLWDEIHGGR